MPRPGRRQPPFPTGSVSISRQPISAYRRRLVIVMGIPGDMSMSLEQLRQAVPGLAGLVGFLLFPTLGAWLRVMVQFMEWNRPGIGRPKRISGLSVLRAIGVTIGLSFFALTLIRAANELRDVQAEAPVVGPSIQGAIVGVCFWAFYAVAMSALRAEWRRNRNEQRRGRALR